MKMESLKKLGKVRK